MADRCRSCDATIEWARTPKGARIPLDLEPRADGNLALDRDGIVHVVAAVPGQKARRSHFVSCPDADRFRRKEGQAVRLLDRHDHGLHRWLRWDVEPAYAPLLCDCSRPRPVRLDGMWWPLDLYECFHCGRKATAPIRLGLEDE